MRSPSAPILVALFAPFCCPSSLHASSLKISVGTQTPSIEADYTTTHLSLNELANEEVTINFAFDPGVTDVESAEIFTNLNRRAFATHAGPDGVEEGIKPPPGNSIKAGDDGHYYRAYPMEPSGGAFKFALKASICGAYRVTARYRKKGDAAGTYRWYSDEKKCERHPRAVRRHPAPSPCGPR
jgi:hypothetical protein